MNFSILAILFLIFSVINSILSGQKQRSKRPSGEKYKPMPPMFKNMTYEAQAQMEPDEEEGLLLEDKSKMGSLNYVEIDNSQEGLQTELIGQNLSVKHDSMEENEYKEDNIYDFHDIRRSIVLAEVLGPPRALKRKIR